MSFEELISEIKKGNKRAERSFFNKLRKFFFVLCLRYVKNIEDAEERMIDGFFKFFTTINSFTYKHDEGMYKWIKKIMINECLMQIRNKNFFSITTVNELYDVSEQDKILSQLATEDILKIIMELPAGYRTVLNMFAIDGFGHEEIASELGISIGSSKSQLFKARCLLQKKLIENGTEYFKQQSK